MSVCVWRRVWHIPREAETLTFSWDLVEAAVCGDLAPSTLRIERIVAAVALRSGTNGKSGFLLVLTTM